MYYNQKNNYFNKKGLIIFLSLIGLLFTTVFFYNSKLSYVSELVVPSNIKLLKNGNSIFSDNILWLYYLGLMAGFRNNYFKSIVIRK
jgi:hypothetical protein